MRRVRQYRFCEKEEAWLAKHGGKIFKQALCEGFNTRFRASLSVRQIVAKCAELGVKHRTGGHGHQFDNEQDAWLHSHAEGRPADDVLERFNRRFDTNVSWEMIRRRSNVLGLNPDTAGRGWTVTAEQEEWLRANARHYTVNRLIEQFEEQFGIRVKGTTLISACRWRQIPWRKIRQGDWSPDETRWVGGHAGEHGREELRQRFNQEFGREDGKKTFRLRCRDARITTHTPGGRKRRIDTAQRNTPDHETMVRMGRMRDQGQTVRQIGARLGLTKGQTQHLIRLGTERGVIDVLQTGTKWDLERLEVLCALHESGVGHDEIIRRMQITHGQLNGALQKARNHRMLARRRAVQWSFKQRKAAVRLAKQGLSWDQIHERMPSRTARQIEDLVYRQLLAEQRSPKQSRYNRKWTGDEVRVLVKSNEHGDSVEAIARRLDRTPGAVRSRIKHERGTGQIPGAKTRAPVFDEEQIAIIVARFDIGDRTLDIARELGNVTVEQIHRKVSELRAKGLVKTSRAARRWTRDQRHLVYRLATKGVATQQIAAAAGRTNQAIKMVVYREKKKRAGAGKNS